MSLAGRQLEDIVATVVPSHWGSQTDPQANRLERHLYAMEDVNDSGLSILENWSTNVGLAELSFSAKFTDEVVEWLEDVGYDVEIVSTRGGSAKVIVS